MGTRPHIELIYKGELSVARSSRRFVRGLNNKAHGYQRTGLVLELSQYISYNESPSGPRKSPAIGCPG